MNAGPAIGVREAVSVGHEATGLSHLKLTLETGRASDGGRRSGTCTDRRQRVQSSDGDYRAETIAVGREGQLTISRETLDSRARTRAEPFQVRRSSMAVVILASPNT